MSTPSVDGKPLTIYRNRLAQWVFTFNATPCEGRFNYLAEGDVVSFKVWSGVDGSLLLEVTSDEESSEQTSGVEITQFDAPASYQVTISPSDTNTIPAGRQQYEVSIAQVARPGQFFVTCRGVAVVLPSPG